jgi:hypothetical protein
MADKNCQRRRSHANEPIGAHARSAAVVRTLVADQHAEQQRAHQVQADEGVGGEKVAAPVVL